MTRDRAVGLVLLIVAGLYYAAARAMPASDLADAVGPAGLPKAYAVALAVLAAVLIIRRRPDAEEHSDLSWPLLRRVVGLLAIGAAYVAVVPLVGYPVTIAGLIIGTSFYQGGRLDGRVVVIGVLGAVLLWLVFVQVLGVAQPVGAWVEAWLGAS